MVYEGLPAVPYEVLGVVECQGPANALARADHRKRMHRLIRERGGNAMIILGREIIRTGSFGSYSGTAYSSGGGMAYGSGSGSSWDKYNYALGVLAIRTLEGTPSTNEAATSGGRDPIAWAKSVLAAGTALLGTETGR